MKVADRVGLSCSHQCRVVWIREDGTQMAVKGTRRRCSACYKDRANATVYLLSIR